MYGAVVGVDYLVFTPYTLVGGVALACGGTSYGLANGLGGGHSDIVAKERPMPASFDAHVASTAETDTIRMTFRSSAVASLSAEPPFPPLPKRVPVTKHLLQDVVDPLSASLLVAPDTGAALGPKQARVSASDF